MWLRLHCQVAGLTLTHCDAVDYGAFVINQSSSLDAVPNRTPRVMCVCVCVCVCVLGVWNKSTAVAIKMLKPGTMKPDEFLQEATIMKRLHHPKLVALYAVCSQGEPILIITELMGGGSLLDCLKTDKGRTIKWNKLIDFATQVIIILSTDQPSMAATLFPSVRVCISGVLLE